MAWNVQSSMHSNWLNTPERFITLFPRVTINARTWTIVPVHGARNFNVNYNWIPSQCQYSYWLFARNSKNRKSKEPIKNPITYIMNLWPIKNKGWSHNLSQLLKIAWIKESFYCYNCDNTTENIVQITWHTDNIQARQGTYRLY